MIISDKVQIYFRAGERYTNADMKKFFQYLRLHIKCAEGFAS